MLGHSPLQACRNSQPIVIDDISKLKGGTFYSRVSSSYGCVYCEISVFARCFHRFSVDLIRGRFVGKCPLFCSESTLSNIFSVFVVLVLLVGAQVFPFTEEIGVDSFRPVRFSSQSALHGLWEETANRFVLVVACVFPFELRRQDVADVFWQSEVGLVRDELILPVTSVQGWAIQPTRSTPSATRQFGSGPLANRQFGFGLNSTRSKGKERVRTNVVSIVGLVLFGSA